MTELRSKPLSSREGARNRRSLERPGLRDSALRLSSPFVPYSLPFGLDEGEPVSPKKVSRECPTRPTSLTRGTIRVLLHSPCRLAAATMTVVSPRLWFPGSGPDLQARSVRGSGRPQRPRPRPSDSARRLLWLVPSSSHSPVPARCPRPAAYPSCRFHFVRPSSGSPPGPASQFGKGQRFWLLSASWFRTKPASLA